MEKTLWYCPKAREFSWERPETEEMEPPEYTPCKVVECEEGQHGETYLLSYGRRITVWCSVDMADAFVGGRQEYYRLKADSVLKEHGVSWDEVISKVCLFLQPTDFEAFAEEHKP